MKRTDDLWYSFSNLETYRKCPRAFKYIYVDKEPILQNEYSLQGSEIHDYLDKMMKKAIDTKSFDINVDFANKYPEILDNFLFLETKRYKKFEDKELYYNNELEQTIKDEDLHLVGKIDRVYYLFNKEKGKVLLDYKTGKTKDIKDNYPQLAIYTYMYNKKNPLNTIKYWEIDYIKEKDKYFLESIDNDIIKEELNRTKKTINDIENDETYEPNISPLCLWCSVLHICPKRKLIINKFKATIEKHNLDINKQIKDAEDYRRKIKGNDKKELIIFSKLAGTTFTEYNLLLIKEEDILNLVREKDNPHDSNAIAVYHNNNKVGYIKKDLARDLHLAIDNGFDVMCSAENITGQDKGNIGVNIRLQIIKNK